MSLRVLLADESATIKKVMQITLQDFAVDIRNVNMGTDVISVAESFQPDIIFIDILLQKKSGYDVAKDLKTNENTTNIPVIMLWNAFMGLDQQKLDDSGAEDNLEKPFDSETLRKVVMKYVKKLQSNPVAEHIQPPPIDWPEDVSKAQTDDEATVNWNMDNFDDLPSLDDLNDLNEEDEEDSFQPLKLAELKNEEENISKEPETTTGGESISRFTLDLPAEELGDFEAHEENEDIEIDTSNLLWGDEAKIEEDNDEEAWKQQNIAEAPTVESPLTEDIPSSPKQPTSNTEIPVNHFSEAELEAYVREHCKDTIEKLARQMVPQMAKELIREELDRLLSEADL